MERLHGSVGFVSRHPRATEDPFDVPTLRRIHPKVRVGVSACRRVGGSAVRRKTLPMEERYCGETPDRKREFSAIEVEDEFELEDDF
jgi:hypothetical protein